jgi:hypothetical protein
MSLETFQNRLRLWSARAAHEVENSSGEIAESWRGQQRVLGAIASYMEGDGARYTPAALRLRLIDDRESARRAWEATANQREVAFHAGEVAAYDLILDVLKSIGAQWG